MRPLLALGELTSDVTGGDFFIHANKKIKCPINMDDFFRSLAKAGALLWRQDATLVDVVLRSLGVSAMAASLACGLGLGLGAWLGVRRFKGEALVEAILHSLLALPSVVVGLVVYLLLSRQGPLGFLGWLFSLKAMVLAQTVLVLPVVVALSRQCIRGAHERLGEQLQSIGLAEPLRALVLVWDERQVLLGVVLTAFGRAVSEVGAVMVVGGNIEGFTRVMTTSIALETSKGDLPMALALGGVLMGVVLLLNALISALHWRHGRRQHLAGASGLSQVQVDSNPRSLS